ncbi:MAG: carbohydrate ABC transporter permease [Eubacteriales bacterium]|nr:carbohydrate ABC transporter permease [Eubacteriales bacterium]
MKKSKAFDRVLILVLAVLALITLYPFYNVLIVSLSNTQSVAKHTPYLLPYAFDLTGYKTILMDADFRNALLVSVFVTVVGVVLNLTLSLVAAYVLSRRYLDGRNAMMTVIVFTMLFSGGLVPTYMVIKDLGLINSVWAMILPSALNTYYLIIMKNYFLGLPEGLFEAARLDGAGEWTMLWKIAVPLSKPIVATFALFYAVDRWNEWYNALLYINQKALAPLQIYLRDILISLNSQLSTQAQQMMGNGGKASTSAIQMATIMITALPIMAIYPYLQKYFVNGVMVGGIKE